MTTLGSLFAGVLNETGASVFDYGDCKDFLELWNDPDPAVGKGVPIIIVWDGRDLVYSEVQETGESDPERKVDPSAGSLLKHLTPLDWALAVSIRCLGGMGRAASNCPRIAILDLTGKDHEEWSMRMRRTLLDAMPWVTLHAPFIEDDSPSFHHRTGYLPILADASGALLRNDGAGWVLNLDQSAVRSNSSAETLKGWARQWSSSLLQTHDHHDLNNIVGPWIILDNRPEPKFPERLAFYRRLELMELLPTAFGDGDDAGNPGDGDVDKSAGNDTSGVSVAGSNAPDTMDASDEDLAGTEGFDVLAIDDNIENWGEVLQRILLRDASAFAIEGESAIPLGERDNVRLWGMKTPQRLMSHLKPDGNNLYTQRVFSPLRDRPWMLVLDLHLFSGDEERKWIGELLSIARSVVSNGQDELAWSGFTDIELLQVQKWFDSGEFGGDSEGYNTALSLFPRLCALRWPAVPILVFSGTGRRKLVSKLGTYGNIFLADQKPNVLGNEGKKQAEAFITSWRREFSAATKLVNVQRGLMALPPTDNVRDDNQPVHRHLVVALDETGRSGEIAKIIGGTVLVSEGADQDDAINNSMLHQEALRAAGASYYPMPPLYADNQYKKGVRVDHNLRKQRSCLDKINVALDSIDGGVKFGAFRYVMDRGNRIDDAFDDHIYLQGLSSTLELFLAEFISSAGFDLSRTTLSIWLPSKLTASSGEQAHQDAMKFDFRWEKILERGEAIGGWGSAYSVLLRAMGERESFAESFKSIKVVRTRKIPYQQTDNDRYNPPLHWYCPTCNKIYFPRSPQLNREQEWNYEIIRCSNNHGQEECVADYSVVQHLADEFLSSNNPIGGQYNEILTPEYCFDVAESDDRTKAFLASARLMDLGDKRAALKQAAVHRFFEAGVNRDSSKDLCGIEKRLRGEIAKYAKRLDGNLLLEMAGLSVRGLSGLSRRVSNGDVANPNPQGKTLQAVKGAPVDGSGKKKYDVPDGYATLVFSGFQNDGKTAIRKMVCQYLQQLGIQNIGKSWFGKNRQNCPTFRVYVPETHVQTVMDTPERADRPWRFVNRM